MIEKDDVEVLTTDSSSKPSFNKVISEILSNNYYLCHNTLAVSLNKGIKKFHKSEKNIKGMISQICEDFSSGISVSFQTLRQSNFCIINIISVLMKTLSLTAQGKSL